MYAAIQQAMQKHMLSIQQLWRVMNEWKPCLHCGGPLKAHATERTMFCSIGCCAEYEHEVSCAKCSTVFAKKGMQGKFPLCKQCKKRNALEAKRLLGKNIAKRAIRFGVERVPYRRSDLLERDDWTCQLCSVSLLRKWTYHKHTLIPHPANATLDHIVAMSNGGADAPWNIQACCFQCNSMKSSKNKGQLRLQL
jgi:5-methylcytosine-specific restriction endonuclease McrA